VKRPLSARMLLYGASALCLLQLAAAGAVAFASRRCAGEFASESSRTAALTADIEALRQQLASRTDPEPARWHLAEVVDVSATLQVLQAAGDQAGIEFSSLKALLASAAGKQSFQVVGRGDPSQLCAWLRHVEQQDRVLVVESGRLSPASTGGIAFDLGIALYHLGGGQ